MKWFDSVRNNPRRRLILMLSALVVASVGGALYFAKDEIWSPIPRDLVGKWEVVQGRSAGSILEFRSNGECVGQMTFVGRTGNLHAKVRVDGDKFHITTTHPITRRSVTATQTLKMLTGEQVIIDEEGKDSVMKRIH